MILFFSNKVVMVAAKFRAYFRLPLLSSVAQLLCKKKQSLHEIKFSSEKI